MAEPLDQDFQKRLVEGYGDCYALSQVRLFKKGFFLETLHIFYKIYKQTSWTFSVSFYVGKKYMKSPHQFIDF